MTSERIPPNGPVFGKFHPGRLVATPGALEALERNNETSLPYLRKHLMGDWGSVDDEDWDSNDQALVDGGRLLSAYRLRDDTKIWIITEADDGEGKRSATTILLPEEY